MQNNFYGITEEQELMIENLEELIRKEVTEAYLVDCYKNHKHPAKYYDVLHRNGYMMLGIPEELGGTPCNNMTHVLVGKTLTKMGGNPFLIALMVDTVLTYGTEEQKKMILGAAKEGKVPYSLGFTEPGAGSDSTAIKTTATRKNGKVYINGQKTFISLADISPYIRLLTRNPDIPKPYEAMTMWLFPIDLPGITVNPQSKIGGRLGSTCEIFFDNVEIPESALLGEENKGFLQLMKNFEFERVLAASYCLGYAEGCFEDAARYANNRVQFGKPIIDFQLTQLKMVEMYTKIENMKSLIYKAAWDKDNGNSIRIASSIVKRYCARSAFEVCDDALQILGGVGYVDDHRVSRMWADARLRRTAAGTDEILVHSSGRLIAGQYK